MTDTRYTFVTEFHDRTAELKKRFNLSFYLYDATVEMQDLKTHRCFLKRSPSQLTIDQLFIGAVVTVNSRQLTIVDYADGFTRRHLGQQRTTTLALIMPHAYDAIGKIVDAIQQNGSLVISRLKMIKLSPGDASRLAGNASADHAAALASDVSVAVELTGDNAVTTLQSLWEAEIAPKFARTAAEPGLRCSADEASAARELRLVFGETAATAKLGATEAQEPVFSLPSTAVCNNCSCLIVRPHALASLGAIADRVLSEGFEISAMKLVALEKVSAAEFLEVYKGVLPEYPALVEGFLQGPCVVMEVRQENVVESLRALCGPHDPQIAKHLRPNTLRAQFGVDSSKNAVHCTDLPEDGLLEVEYLFKMIE